MYVKDVMTKTVISINKKDSVIKASRLMAKHDLGFLVVKNDSNKVMGVITDRDIVLRMLALNKTGLIVEDVMTYVAQGINYKASIEDALEIMGKLQLRRLVVWDENEKLCGVISLADISHFKYTSSLIVPIYSAITSENEKQIHPLKYLKVDDFPL